MVFNATFNNMSVRPWWSVLFVEQTGVSGENLRPGAVTDKLYHGIRIHNFSGERYWCKPNYNAITTTTALFLIEDRTKLEK